MTKDTPGWDYFTPENTEAFEYQTCRVCNSPWQVEKNVNSATTGGEARAGKKHIHDVLTCPNSGTDWHDQALDMLKEAEKTASMKFEASLREEAAEIVKTKTASKPGYQKKGWF